MRDSSDLLLMNPSCGPGLRAGSAARWNDGFIQRKKQLHVLMEAEKGLKREPSSERSSVI